MQTGSKNAHPGGEPVLPGARLQKVIPTWVLLGGPPSYTHGNRATGRRVTVQGVLLTRDGHEWTNCWAKNGPKGGSSFLSPYCERKPGCVDFFVYV